jgi:hypothetical protein
MPEELYNSHDYCLLVEEFESLKAELAEVTADKINLIAAAMDGGDTFHYIAHDMGYRDMERKVKYLEADYVISNRELLIKQAEIQRLTAELARRDEELIKTDDLLKEATETIGAVIACCTYNSNDDAKIGVYGIDHNAFTRIDQFITHYNDAVSAGKVSVDVKTSTDNNKGE